MIILDGLDLRKFTKEIKEEFESYQNVVSISLSNCRIFSLANFPAMQNLLILDLSQNTINFNELHYLKKCSKIKEISFKQCMLSKVEQIKDLALLKDLRILNIKYTELSEQPDYR